MKSSTQVVQDLIKPYIDRNAANIAPVETSVTAAAAHAAGTQIVYKGVLYDVTADIAQGDTITVGTNITAADPISSEIQTLTNVRAELGAHNLGKKYNGVTNTGLTIKDAPDGGNYVNGTATNSGGRLNLRSDNFVLKAGTYSVVGESNDHSKYSAVVLQKTSDSSVLGTYVISYAGVDKSRATFTLVADTECYFGFNTYGGTAYGTDTFIIYPMVRLADDKDDTFYPYAKTNTELTKDTKGLTDNQFANGAVNLLENKATSATKNGITMIVNADGTLTFTSDGTTRTGNTDFDIAPLSNGFPATDGVTYHLSGCPSGGSISDKYGLMVAGYNIWDLGSGVDFTARSTTGIPIRIYVRIYKDYAFSGSLTFKPMITVADMPNSDYAYYVPYVKSNKELTDDLATESVTVPIYTHANSDIEYATFKKTGNVVSMSLNFTLSSGDTPLSTGLLTADGAVPAAYRHAYAAGATCVISARDNTTFSLANYYFVFIVVSKSGAITLRGKDTELANCIGFSGTLTYVI